jgi:hypothetical protein
MEKLVLCSKVLFDHDLLDKSKHIIELKTDMEFHVPPKKQYRNEKEWLDVVDGMKERIKLFIYELFDEDSYEYNLVETMGLTPRWSVLFLDRLREEFVRLSGEPKWSN